MILEWRETTVHYTYYNSLLAGLSQQENKERIHHRERPLSAPDAFFHAAADHICGRK